MELYLHNGIAVGCSASPWTYFNWPIKTKQELHVQFAFRYKTCALGPHCVFLCTVWFSASSREQHEFNWSSWRTAFFVTRLHAIPINFSHPVLTVKAKVRFRNSPREICGGQTAKGTGLFLPTFSVSPVSIIPSSFYSLFSSVTITPPITYILFSPVSIIPPTIYTLLPLSVTFHQYPIFPFPLSVSF